jgi:predicted GNAT family N-acyltransferase
VIAGTAQEIVDAQRLRAQVYCVEEGLLPASASVDGREIDARDVRDDTLHFVAYSDGEPAGTVRLLLPNVDASTTRAGRLGLDLDAKFDLAMLATAGVSPAEVTRYCVPRRYRHTGAARALFLALHAESLRRGITHWLAGANMETDVPSDAAIAYGVARARRLLHPRVRAEARVLMPPVTAGRRPFYTEEQRRRAFDGDFEGLALPRTLGLFALRMGARYIGSPAYDAQFGVFALPLVATLADIAVGQSPASPPLAYSFGRMDGELPSRG